MLNKKLRYQYSGAFWHKLCTLDLSGTKATRANVNGSVGTVNYCLNPTNVGLPGSVGLTVGVRHVVSKGNALTADTALSHFDTSKNPAHRSVILYKIYLFA